MKHGWVLLLLAWALWGQEFRATLTGRVVDPSDAPIAGASVNVKNAGTNVAQAVKTDSRGNYTAALLPPGAYSVTVTAPGFKVANRFGLQLTVAETTTVDFKLEIGQISQEVTVTAERPQSADARDSGAGRDLQRGDDLPAAVR